MVQRDPFPQHATVRAFKYLIDQCNPHTAGTDRVLELGHVQHLG